MLVKGLAFASLLSLAAATPAFADPPVMLRVNAPAVSARNIAASSNSLRSRQHVDGELARRVARRSRHFRTSEKRKPKPKATATPTVRYDVNKNASS